MAELPPDKRLTGFRNREAAEQDARSDGYTRFKVLPLHVEETHARQAPAPAPATS